MLLQAAASHLGAAYSTIDLLSSSFLARQTAVAPLPRVCCVRNVDHNLSARHDHRHRLLRIHLESHPSEAVRENVQRLLDFDRAIARNGSVVCIELRLERSIHIRVLVSPETDDSIDDNIENHRRQDIALPHPSRCLKWLPIETCLLRHHRIAIPDPPNQPSNVFPDAVLPKNLNRSIAIERIVRSITVLVPLLFWPWQGSGLL